MNSTQDHVSPFFENGLGLYRRLRLPRCYTTHCEKVAVVHWLSGQLGSVEVRNLSHEMLKEANLSKEEPLGGSWMLSPEIIT